MSISPTDERPHPPGLAGGREVWSLAFTDPGGLAARVSTTVDVDAGAAAVSVIILQPDTGPLVVRDRMALRGEGWELRGDGVWVNQCCEVPFEHWTYGLEAFSVALAHPHDAWDGERGDRVPIGWELDWEVDGAPFDLGAGYVQPGVVHGEVLIGDASIAIDGRGLRSHAWGASVGVTSMWWRDDGSDIVVSGPRAIRWSGPDAQVVDVRDYDSTVDTRGFPHRVDLVLGAEEVAFEIAPYAWAAEITSESPFTIVPHTAFTARRDGAVVGYGWQAGTP